MRMDEFRQLVATIAGTSGNFSIEAANDFAQSLPALDDDVVRDLDGATANAIIDGWVRDYTSTAPQSTTALPQSQLIHRRSPTPVPVRRGGASDIDTLFEWRPLHDHAPELAADVELATLMSRPEGDAPATPVTRPSSTLDGPTPAVDIGARLRPAGVQAAQEKLNLWASDSCVTENERRQRHLLAEFLCDHLAPSDDGSIRVTGDIGMAICAEITALPEGLHIIGDLALGECTGLTSLPHGLHVGGSLKVSSCTNLSTLCEDLYVGHDLAIINCARLANLPERFHVSGHLAVAYCAGLERLPENLEVLNDLYLIDCAKIASLPNAWQIGGNIHIGGCTSLAELPATLELNGDLELTDCDGLRSLPTGLHVRGSLRISACAALSELPQGLVIGAKLQLNECEGIRSLPHDLRVNEAISLNSCRNLAALPPAFCVGGSLSLERCTALTKLPADLRVAGALRVGGCTGLTAIPKTMRIGGDVVFAECPGITSFPDGFAVHANLGLVGCTELVSLPRNLRVRANLDLGGCSRLTALPAGLRVAGNLDLVGCTNLASLPEGLFVGGDLYLTDCTALTSLPNSLSVGHDISLVRCTNVTSLPPAVLAWPPHSLGQPHLIYIDGSGIPERVVDRIITEVQPTGVELISYSQTTAEAAPTWTSPDDALAYWTEQAASAGAAPRSANNDGEQAESGENEGGDRVDAAESSRTTGAPRTADWNLDDDACSTLRDYLARLRETADFENRSTRRILAGRIVGLVRTMDALPDLRELLLAQMAVALTSCGDRLALSLNDMEIAERMALIEGSPAQQHQELARSLIALEEVRRLADAKVRSLPSFDEIEIRLAYEIRVGMALREASRRAGGNGIELPVSTRAMLYPACAGQVTSEDIEVAADMALTAARDETRLKNFLSSWPAWQRMLRAEQAAALKRDDIVVTPDSMLTAEHRAALMSSCPISLSPPEPDQLVFVNAGSTLHVFDFSSLLQHWVEHGTNPVNRQTLDLAQIRRPI